ncbi:hypothetical protein HPP92_027763 [Vanilla planifolia]|uniref:Secreted protein n=1 Tax=Vanilla planifolia TaxID=51239 RepID=A0A835U5I0_VANPL|nr:hypothetical protein HPP92_027763 [Vanilla planifolia]
MVLYYSCWIEAHRRFHLLFVILLLIPALLQCITLAQGRSSLEHSETPDRMGSLEVPPLLPSKFEGRERGGYCCNGGIDDRIKAAAVRGDMQRLRTLRGSAGACKPTTENCGRCALGHDEHKRRGQLQLQAPKLEVQVR